VVGEIGQDSRSIVPVFLGLRRHTGLSHRIFVASAHVDFSLDRQLPHVPLLGNSLSRPITPGRSHGCRKLCSLFTPAQHAPCAAAIQARALADKRRLLPRPAPFLPPKISMAEFSVSNCFCNFDASLFVPIECSSLLGQQSITRSRASMRR
jgi:hypothetical protein